MTTDFDPTCLHRLVPGIPDELFLGPVGPSLIKQEVRLVMLGKLLGDILPGEAIWDIAAGAGALAVEAAILRPEIRVLTLEPDEQVLQTLRTNVHRFQIPNIQVVFGPPLEVLPAAPAPRAVVVNDRSQPLDPLLELVGERLPPGGWLVAGFTVLEHLGALLQFLRRRRWPHEVAEIQVARTDPAAGFIGLRPQRAVYVVRGEKVKEKSTLGGPGS